MDNTNWWLSPPAMGTNDWRSELPTDSRQKIANKIMETLRKHLPFSGPEGINELRRISARFEEKIFSGAVSQTDYLQKISMKMLAMETGSQNSAGSSPSITADMGDWRNQLSSDSRQKNFDKLMKTLKEHVPYSGEEGINNLMRIAVSFEDLIFNTAINQANYFHKISLKMQSIEGGN